MSNDLRYVAFCDILGFSNSILNDFDAALASYQALGEILASSETSLEGVEATMYSDAVLITGESLPSVLRAVQNFWFFALMRDFMIRGAIAHGRYWVRRIGGHLFVASDALVRAVKLERSVGVPAVVIADDIEIPDSYWAARFSNETHGQYITPLLHFRDRNIVNPFHIMWHRSAGDRARKQMELSPRYKDKYLWFLALHQAVGDGEPLVPPTVLARFMRMIKSQDKPPSETPHAN